MRRKTPGHSTHDRPVRVRVATPQASDPPKSLSVAHIALIAGAPLATGAMVAYFASARWPCIDDGITRWAALEAVSFCDVGVRSRWTSHLPTFFWLVRAADVMGGPTGSWIAAAGAPWLITGLTLCHATWLQTRSRCAAFAATALGTTLLHPAIFVLCLRPYGWIMCLCVIALTASLHATRRQSQRAAWIATAAAATLPHMSLAGTPVALAFVAIHLAASADRAQRIRLTLIALGGMLPAFVKLIEHAGRWSTHAWMQGAPMTGQLWYAALAFLPGLLCALSTPERETRATVACYFVACVNPLVILFSAALLDVQLFAPRYHAPEVACVAVLVATLVGSVRVPIIRVAAAGSCLALPTALSIALLTAVGPRLKPFAAPSDVVRYVASQRAPHDLVLVTSPYAEASDDRYYTTPTLRAYLLAHLLDASAASSLDAFPAPPAHSAPTSAWRRQVSSLLQPESRIWFVPQASWRGLWDPSALNRRASTLAALEAMGFTELRYPLPDEITGRLVVLRPPTSPSPASHASMQQPLSNEPK